MTWSPEPILTDPIEPLETNLSEILIKARF